jgi:hypothetical protein
MLQWFDVSWKSLVGAPRSVCHPLVGPMGTPARAPQLLPVVGVGGGSVLKLVAAVIGGRPFQGLAQEAWRPVTACKHPQFGVQ